MIDLWGESPEFFLFQLILHLFFKKKQDKKKRQKQPTGNTLENIDLRCASSITRYKSLVVLRSFCPQLVQERYYVWCNSLPAKGNATDSYPTLFMATRDSEKGCSFRDTNGPCPRSCSERGTSVWKSGQRAALRQWPQKPCPIEDGVFSVLFCSART